MRAVIFSGPGEVAVTQVPDPVLREATDALVRVNLAGICGTDLHAVAGQLPGLDPGTVLGHEFVGTVVEVGTAVRRLRPGDRVMSSDFTACGDCWWCRRGSHWQCPRRQFFGTGTTFGPALAGAQAEFVRVPFADTTLAALPAGVDPVAGLLIGDNLATGWVAVQRAGVRPGDVVAVVGGGPIGQLVSLCAQVHGAAAVVLSDPVAQRRDLAADQGALTASPDAARAVLDSLTDGRGADVVVEAAGGPRGLDAALLLVRPAGSVVSVSAHGEQTWAFPLAAAFAAETTLSFVIGDSIRVRDRLSAVVAAGVLDPRFVVTGHRGLAEAVSSYGELSMLQGYKVVLDPQENR
jgi:alcohol dehydrogenase